jgi:hypothetical protein
VLPTPDVQGARDLLAGHAPQAVPGPAAIPADGLFPGGGHCTLGTTNDLPFLTTQDILRTLHILRC